MELFGREELLRELMGSSAPLTLLVGDSGTGKTSILEELQERSVEAVAPAPVQVKRAPGSLQVALLEGLGAAVALLAEDASATQRIGQLLADAAGRVVDLRLKDLRSAIARHLLSVVRARVGTEMADLLQDFSTSLTGVTSDALSARITAASDNDVVDQIASFSFEVEALACGRAVCLALDDTDRLDDADLSRLADLLDELSPSVRIRASFSTWHTTSRARSERLLIGGAVPVLVTGLAREHVEDWLEAQGLERDLADAVMSSTNGYPVHVEDALAILTENPSPTSVDSMGPDDVTEVRARQAWRELDPISQVAAAKLAAYVDPLPTPRVCSLLDVDEMAWGTLELRLVDAGLLLGDRRRWFHELRRRALWRSILSETMRTAAIEAATDEIRTQLALPQAGPDDLVDFARIASQNTALQHTEPSVRAASSATSDEIAVAAAALELVEASRGEKAINAETLLAHARDVYGVTGDAISALDRLSERDLLYVTSNDRMSVVVPMWGSTEAIQVILGRAASEFGRVPIVQLATAVFETVIRPKLGTFDMAMYGVGSPSVRSAAEEVASMHRRPEHGVVHVGRHDPGLFFRGSLGAVPIYASVAYVDIAERDQAALGLTESEAEVWEEPFTVSDVVSLPGSSVPSLRFGRAVDWLDGRAKFDLHMPRGLDADIPVEVRAEVEARQEVRSIVRTLTSPEERYAYGLEVITGYAYSQAGDGRVTIEVIGVDWVRDIPPSFSWDGSLTKPFFRLRLAEALDLGRDQLVGRIQWRSGGIMQDPVTHEITDLIEAAAAFNKLQRPIDVRFDEEELRRRLHSAFEQVESDGRALVAALPRMGLTLPEPTTTYILLELDEPAPGWIPGAHADLRTATFPSLAGDDRVVFKMMGGVDADWSKRAPTEELMLEAFDVDVRSAHSHSYGEALGSLARLLGYGRGEVRFLYADD